MELFITPVNCLKLLIIRVFKSCSDCSSQYFNSKAMPIAASISITDPRAISKNRLRSTSDLREHPSEIFRCTDKAALRICDIMANFSSEGNDIVIR